MVSLWSSLLESLWFRTFRTEVCKPILLLRFWPRTCQALSTDAEVRLCRSEVKVSVRSLLRLKFVSTHNINMGMDSWGQGVFTNSGDSMQIQKVRSILNRLYLKLCLRSPHIEGYESRVPGMNA